MQKLFPMMCSSIRADGLDIKKYLYLGLILSKVKGKFFGNGGSFFPFVEQSVRPADSQHLGGVGYSHMRGRCCENGIVTSYGGGTRRTRPSGELPVGPAIQVENPKVRGVPNCVLYGHELRAGCL